MNARRILFVAALYLMAVVTFFAFVSSVVPWFQFRHSSTPATLVVQPDPIINGPDDERKLASEQRTNGHSVQLKLASGEILTSYAHLTTEQYKQASTNQGVHVLFRNDGPNKVQVISDLQELDSPWLWLVLAIAFSFAAPFARKLYIRERQ